MARFALLVAALAAFLVTTAAAILLIPLLGKLDLERSLRSAFPAEKKGVPTMGGICVMVGVLFGIALAWVGLTTIEPQLADPFQRLLISLALCSSLGFGVIGVADDLLRVTGRGTGLRLWQKLVCQTVVAALFLAGLHLGGALDTGMVLPAVGYVDLGVWYYPISFAVILFFVNAVNITDGPDGLCCTVSFAAMAGYLAVYGMLNYFQLAILPAAMAGALLAFTLWNFYPAKVLMGSTGSMFLGGAVIACAYCVGWPGLLPLLGGVFLVQGVSVLLQAAAAKCGKRLFRAAPLHRALAAKGWSDLNITFALGGMAAAGTLLAILFVRVSG